MLPAKSSRNLHRLDIIFLVMLPIFASIISLMYQTNLLISTLLFYGIPSLYFTLRSPKHLLKSLLFALGFGIPFSLFVDYIAVRGHIWFSPTIFPFRVAGGTAFEYLIWGFLFVYFIIMFYEHLLDKGRHKIVEKRFKYLVFSLMWLFIIVVSLGFIASLLVSVPYTYFWFALILWIIPVVIFLYKFPSLTIKFLKVGSYFLLVNLLFELTALHLGQWQFLDVKFIGWVELLGYGFPFEEFLSYLVLGSTGVLTYFEFFDDDCR